MNINCDLKNRVFFLLRVQLKELSLVFHEDCRFHFRFELNHAHSENRTPNFSGKANSIFPESSKALPR